MIASLMAGGLVACQTAPTANSGLLARYDGMTAPGHSLRASVLQRRDDAASDSIGHVYLQPADLAPAVGEGLTETERAMVLREVDRQICFEVSERFAIALQPANDVATVRTHVVRIQPTGRVASALTSATRFVVPVVKFRVPMTTGGLAVESELLAPQTGEQVAALAWAREAQIVGLDTPSLSRVGDALQLAEPMGDAVGDAFASARREIRPIPDPDPCLRFGPRRDLGRSATEVLVGAAVGLYSPEASGTGARSAAPTP